MNWNPWTTIKKLGEQLAEFEAKYGILENEKKDWIDRAFSVRKECDELNERIAILESQLADSEFKITEIKLGVKAALDGFAPSPSVLKSNKALRMELDGAKSAIDNARFVLER